MSYTDSETISRLIIDKLIFNAIIENKKKEINSKLKPHIEKYIFDLISPYMKSEFIFHETDRDTIEQNIIHFDKNKISKINSWVTIPEPETCAGDRFAWKNKLLKCKLQKSDKHLLIHENPLKEQEYDDIKNNIINNKIKLTLKKKSKKYSIKTIKKNILNNKQKIEANTNESYNNNDKKKQPILEIQGINIPYDNNEKINILINDTQENNYLRNEWKIKQIEKGKKLLIEQAKIKNEKSKFLYKNDSKLFNPTGLTFDSNGKIIRLNLQNINSLNQDFLLSKIKLKDINQENTPSTTSQKLFNNKNKLSENNIKDNNEEVVEYNYEARLRYERNFFFNLNKNKNDKKDDEKMLLMGSNFNKINPEIGVIISNDNNEKEKKSGGFDYIKKYNRPSMNEFSQYLSNSNNNNNNLNSNSKIASFLYSYSNPNIINTNINNEKKNNNYIGYKESFNEEKNPLFKNAVHFNEKIVKKSRNSLLKKDMVNKKSLSNENIFKRNNKFKKNIIILKEQNINYNDNDKDSYNNYLSSVNNILLSQKFSFPNLKSVFSEENDNHIITDTNKINNKNLGNVKIMKENKSHAIYSFNDIKNANKRFLPSINLDKINNKKEIGLNYINKFLADTIKRRNMSCENLDNKNNINKENSYKNIFLRNKKYINKI